MGEDSKDHLVQVLTETGKTFVSKHEDVFEQPPASTEPAETFRRLANEKVDGNLSVDTSAIASWLEECFEHDLWAEISQRCHGCGACAAVCPTCHCFDIVDEPQGIDKGVRRRNWDTCQTPLFTLHGAGHNPRPDQASRIRQRISHKFFIYPKRFSEILCTGCGRCARVCAAGMDLPDILRKVDALSSPAKSEATGTGGSA
ncbi:MAG: 4Fe-4S dicluster domain-containing protein [Myxococcota bacterium]